MHRVSISCLTAERGISLGGAESFFHEPCTPNTLLALGGQVSLAGPSPQATLSYVLMVARLRIHSPQEMGRRDPSPVLLHSLPISSLENRFGNIGGFLFFSNGYIGASSTESHNQLFFITTPKVRVLHLQRNHLESLSNCSKDVVTAQNIFSTSLLGSSLEASTHSFQRYAEAHHHQMGVDFFYFLKQAEAIGVVSGNPLKCKMICLHTLVCCFLTGSKMI